MLSHCRKVARPWFRDRCRLLVSSGFGLGLILVALGDATTRIGGSRRGVKGWPDGRLPALWRNADFSAAAGHRCAAAVCVRMPACRSRV